MPKFKTLAVVAGTAALAVTLTACNPFSGDSKYTQQYQDAAVGGKNTQPAEIGTMPDGFSNWASKCDGPNRVYTIFHYSNSKNTGGDTYGALAVVPNDPRCKVGP